MTGPSSSARRWTGALALAACPSGISGKYFQPKIFKIFSRYFMYEPIVDTTGPNLGKLSIWTRTIDTSDQLVMTPVEYYKIFFHPDFFKIFSGLETEQRLRPLLALRAGPGYYGHLLPGRVETSHWSRYVEILCSDWLGSGSALLCHKDTAQGIQNPLLGSILAFHCVFMA